MAEEPSNSSVSGFTPNEVKMLVECFKCLKGDAASMIDFEQVATNLGMKGAKSARDRFGNIRRAKFPGATGAGAVVAGDGVEKAAVKKKSPAKPRKVAEQKEGGSPAKRARKPKAAKGEVKEEGTEAVDEGGPVKVVGAEEVVEDGPVEAEGAEADMEDVEVAGEEDADEVAV